MPEFAPLLAAPLLAGLLLPACTAPGDDAPGDDTDQTGLVDRCDQTPAGEVALPADDAQHDEAVEWWYWTGHLTDEQGVRYGFEQAMFVFQITGYRATSAHVALTEVDAGRFAYDIGYAHGEVPEVVADGFAMAAEADSATGGDGADHLEAVIPDADGGPDKGFTLDLVDAKAPVLHHGDGYHDYDVGGYTWYYSRPRMDVSGTITVDGEARAVTGTGWFDHQWGDLLAASTAGWDWFALQLDDGREVMLFMVRGSDALVGGTITDAGCNSTELTGDDVVVEPLGEWTSPTSGCTYPQGWSVRVGAETFRVDAVLPEQELVNDYQTYWEGESVVSGDATGRAYVELAGYCS